MSRPVEITNILSKTKKLSGIKSNMDRYLTTMRGLNRPVQAIHLSRKQYRDVVDALSGEDKKHDSRRPLIYKAIPVQRAQD